MCQIENEKSLAYSFLCWHTQSQTTKYFIFYFVFVEKSIVPNRFEAKVNTSTKRRHTVSSGFGIKISWSDIVCSSHDIVKWTNLFNIGYSNLFFCYFDLVKERIKRGQSKSETEGLRFTIYSWQYWVRCCVRLFVFIRLNRIKSLIHIWIHLIKSQYKQRERLRHLLLLFFYSKLFYVNSYVWTCECECVRVHGFASVYIIAKLHNLCSRDHFVRKIL